jgi:hypothetical protein
VKSRDHSAQQQQPDTLAQVLASPGLAVCPLHPSPNLSVPQFPHLENRNSHSTQLIETRIELIDACKI